MSEEPPIKDSESQALALSRAVENVNQHGLPEDTQQLKTLFDATDSRTVAKAMFTHPPTIEPPNAHHKLAPILKKDFIKQVTPEFSPIEPSQSDLELAQLNFEKLIPPTGERTVQPHNILADIASYLALPTRPDNMTDNERILWREHTSRALKDIGTATGHGDLNKTFRSEYKQNQLGAIKLNIVTGNVEQLHMDIELPDEILEMNEALKLEVVDQSSDKSKGSDYSKMSTEKKLEVVEKTRELARTVVKHFM